MPCTKKTEEKEQELNEKELDKVSGGTNPYAKLANIVTGKKEPVSNTQK